MSKKIKIEDVKEVADVIKFVVQYDYVNAQDWFDNEIKVLNEDMQYLYRHGANDEDEDSISELVDVNVIYDVADIDIVATSLLVATRNTPDKYDILGYKLDLAELFDNLGVYIDEFLEKMDNTSKGLFKFSDMVKKDVGLDDETIDEDDLFEFLERYIDKSNKNLIQTANAIISTVGSGEVEKYKDFIVDNIDDHISYEDDADEKSAVITDLFKVKDPMKYDVFNITGYSRGEHATVYVAKNNTMSESEMSKHLTRLFYDQPIFMRIDIDGTDDIESYDMDSYYKSDSSYDYEKGNFNFNRIAKDIFELSGDLTWADVIKALEELAPEYPND